MCDCANIKPGLALDGNVPGLSSDAFLALPGVSSFMERRIKTKNKGQGGCWCVPLLFFSFNQSKLYRTFLTTSYISSTSIECSLYFGVVDTSGYPFHLPGRSTPYYVYCFTAVVCTVGLLRGECHPLVSVGSIMATPMQLRGLANRKTSWEFCPVSPASSSPQSFV
jgi:hypothetical protein